MVTTAHDPSLDDIDTQLGERYYRDRKDIEDRLTNEIIDVIREYIDKRFQQGRRPALRDAHAKDNGIVRALFRVDPDLDQELQQGIFAPGKEYKAWIRFSNGNSEPRGERSPDARGMAIKLMGVKGPKLLNDEVETQDFIMINSPVFFVDDLQRYKETLREFLTPGVIAQNLSILKLRGWERWLAIKANAGVIVNPLLSQYWSTTPYRLGIDPTKKMAIKFTARPSGPQNQRPSFVRQLSTFITPGFSLKAEMDKTLSSEKRFDFYIQRYVDERTPIEDTKVEWKESVSKLRHVATIIIPPQKLFSGERDAFCENLSFSPWHCLPEHKPLGAVNRVRKNVYLKNSEHRHKLNGVAKTEPTGNEPF
jgi:Catalase